MGLLRKGGVASRANIGLFLCVAFAGLLARGIMIAISSPAGGLLRFEPSVIAANLNAGRGFIFEQYGAMYHAWKEPLYIVLLAGLTRWVGESTLAVLLFQGFFGVATAVGVALITRHLLGDPTRAMMAGMIAAANPFLIYYDTQLIHPLSMNTLFFVLSSGTILLAIGVGPGRSRRALLAGIVTGLVLWQRATLLAAGVASWTMTIVAGAPRERRRIAGQAAIWLVVAILVISPWLARNYMLFGRLVLTTDFAHVLWLGNNPCSNGTYSDLKGQRVIYLADPAFQARIYGASEITQYDIFLGEMWRFIAEHPGTYTKLTLGRLWAFFWFSPNAGVEYTTRQNVLYRVAYPMLLGLGLLGLVLYWRRADNEGRCRALVLLASVFGLAAVHALTAINLNHRVPLELVLAVFAAESLGQGTILVRAYWQAVAHKRVH